MNEDLTLEQQERKTIDDLIDNFLATEESEIETYNQSKLGTTTYSIKRLPKF